MKSALALFGLCVSGVAHATTLSLTMVADDFFDAYVSTNDSSQGTLFLQQTNTWQSGAVTGSITLTPNVVNYLHVAARDVFGAPSMIIGEASLSGGGFFFPNSATSLLTNTSDWKLSLTGFGSGYFTPTDLGANGTSPWGLHSGIASTARRLWSGQTSGIHSFSVAMTPVPEPLTLLVLAPCVAWTLRSRRGVR
jgi:hypothetical protein